MAELEWQVFADPRHRIESVRQTSPGFIFRAFSPSTEVVSLDLRDAPPARWADRCRRIADTYVQAGETNVALFWLNVAAEALLQDRIEEASRSFGIDLGAVLSSPAAYWDEARTLVEAHAPGISGTIPWPQDATHVSVYRKLKYLHRHYPMAAEGDDVIAHYSRVSRHRNALFHGFLQARLPVEDVERARDSLSWLIANLHAQKAST
jgi:hypothetical protein